MAILFFKGGGKVSGRGLPVYHPSKLLEFRKAPDLTGGALYSLHAISCGQRPLGRPGGHKGLSDLDDMEGHDLTKLRGGDLT